MKGVWQKRNYRAPKFSPGPEALNTNFEARVCVVQVSSERKLPLMEDVRCALQTSLPAEGRGPGGNRTPNWETGSGKEGLLVPSSKTKRQKRES